jgi:hypothetical protein
MTHTGHDGFRPYIDLPRPLILDSNIVSSVERDESSPVTWEFTIRLLERMADALAPVGQPRDEEPVAAPKILARSLRAKRESHFRRRPRLRLSLQGCIYPGETDTQ